jgi:hypothetical protein
MKYKIEPLTLYDIQRSTTNYLRSVVKNGADDDVRKMAEKELYRRETRRSIT